jgi:hypothetical protein
MSKKTGHMVHSLGTQYLFPQAAAVSLPRQP